MYSQFRFKYNDNINKKNIKLVNEKKAKTMDKSLCNRW